MTVIDLPAAATPRTGLSPATRRLLTCGVIAGPLFVAVTLIQMGTKEGFDPARHPLSMLSTDDLGWIQIANFTVAGLLAFAGSIGLRRALGSGPASRWAPILLGAYGISLIWGGVFVADPALGYPVGTPDGSPEQLSWHGALHAIAPAAAGLGLVVACFVIARRFNREHRRGWAIYSVVTAVAYLALTGVYAPTEDFRYMLAGGIAIWLWASAVPAQALAGRHQDVDAR